MPTMPLSELPDHLSATYWTKRKAQERIADEVSEPDDHAMILGFNNFIAYAAKRGVGINSERYDFWKFCHPTGINEHGPRPLSEWWELWDIFCELQDAADEQDTQDAALERP